MPLCPPPAAAGGLWGNFRWRTVAGMDPLPSQPVPPATSPTVQLLTKAGCHLCENARTVVAQVSGELGLAWDEVDIAQDAQLGARYGEEIPVVLVDGVPRDFWHIDPERLRAILTSLGGGH